MTCEKVVHRHSLGIEDAKIKKSLKALFPRRLMDLLEENLSGGLYTKSKVFTMEHHKSGLASCVSTIL